MRAYVAGPMRGIPEFNQPAFNNATSQLRARGWEIWSPAEDNIAHGLDTGSMSGDQAEAEQVRPLRECLAGDLSWICLHAECVVVLPGWENSLGAQAEAAAARALGLPVLTLSDALAGGGS